MRNQVHILEGLRFDRIPFDELFAGNEPVVMRGLVADWPLVQAAMQSPDLVTELLSANYNGQPVIAYIGEPQMRGRFGYNENLTGFNYRAERHDLREVLELIRAGRTNPQHPYYYMNSIVVDECFPALSRENALRFDHPDFDRYPHVGKIWIGNESVAAAHFDIPRNIACCALGRRRFTLFRPEQIRNLYPGPLDVTPGGQVVTLANLQQPDYARFPRLREALDEAWVVDLEPGDALYYPSLWWHEVEARDPFNVMMNYWWIDSPAYMGNPMDVMMHAMLGLRDRAPADRRGWRALFDYYVFDDSSLPRAHLPEHAHGALGPMDEEIARRLRASVHYSLNR
jgi:Cupin-like domain